MFEGYALVPIDRAKNVTKHTNVSIKSPRALRPQ